MAIGAQKDSIARLGLFYFKGFFGRDNFHIVSVIKKVYTERGTSRSEPIFILRGLFANHIFSDCRPRKTCKDCKSISALFVDQLNLPQVFFFTRTKKKGEDNLTVRLYSLIIFTVQKECYPNRSYNYGTIYISLLIILNGSKRPRTISRNCSTHIKRRRKQPCSKTRKC